MNVKYSKSIEEWVRHKISGLLEVSYSDSSFYDYTCQFCHRSLKFPRIRGWEELVRNIWKSWHCVLPLTLSTQRTICLISNH